MNAHAVLIEAKDLAALPPKSVLILDCRFALADPGKGESDYLDAHIPGAVYASLDRDLSDLSKQGLGRHPLPDVPVFARSLSRWGWRRGMRVVVYDDAGGALAAARAWWMLRTAGIEAQVLDGGWGAWRAAGLPVESGAAVTKRASPPIALAIDTHAVVYYPELERLRARAPTLMLDARAAPRFRGEEEPLDRVGGHVPGARNRPFSENLQADGRFKPPGALRDEFARVLDGRDPRDVIHMCGSGVTACHNLLAMEAAGLHGSRLFAPSWSGWISDPSRLIATGD
ncbi:MAG: Thiosulfate sulfurtransferase, rhodanese [Rhodanobacteraceae bacterium]|jgi:thiosulfate/3-mercaptopyruvate sulfurtransferase|nr:MAG: Thiosulfate sulfurtransferase, rhodanese [Rhodanobacteraceae bacterium]